MYGKVLLNHALVVLLLGTFLLSGTVSANGSRIGSHRTQASHQSMNQRRALQQEDQSTMSNQDEVVLVSKDSVLKENVLESCIGILLEDCQKFLKKKYPTVEVVEVQPKEYNYNRIMIRYNNETGKCDLTPNRG